VVLASASATVGSGVVLMYVFRPIRVWHRQCEKSKKPAVEEKVLHCTAHKLSKGAALHKFESKVSSFHTLGSLRQYPRNWS
jgi:hypothetical protein